MATSFTFEAVANSVAANGDGGVGLAVDKSGNPGIAFCQSGNGQVIVARRNAGTWTHENAQDAFAAQGNRPCFAIDSKGNPHLAYRHFTSAELVHTVKSGSQWSSKVIATRIGGFPPTAGISGLAFALHPGHFTPASLDVAYFVYVDLGTGTLACANTGSGRTPTTVDHDQTGMTKFLGPAAMFDPSENFFVAYVGAFSTGSPQDQISVRMSQLTDDIKGTFSPFFTADKTPLLNVQRAPALVQNILGTWLAYCDNTSKTLKAFIDLSGASAIETIASNVSPFIEPSAAYSQPADEFCVAYADHDGVKLASRSRIGDWTVETVDTASAGPVSLAFDNTGTAHIAYVAGGTLKYARRAR